MKFKGQIFSGEEDGLISRNIYYDEELTKGLLSVGTNSFINKNIKTLDITAQLADNHQTLGVKYSKNYDFVAVTISFINEDLTRETMQFIIQDACRQRYINNCNHFVLNGLKDVLVKGLNLLKAVSVEDLIMWSEDKDIN
jgi:hypothetical protein